MDEHAAGDLGIKGHPRVSMPDLVDAVIVLGGDGTMLSVARLVAKRDIPILGINLGSLGFITEVNRDEIQDALDTMIGGEWSVEERLMLSAHIHRKGEVLKDFSV